ncbi:XRE family transcriptional regulator [Actinomadura sp. 7K507]|uniref:XRE family transcriptional regulator n=1 Tax=Actinomadura sp. 7K507 TaxID=2530365 RepID=UPI001049519D|nr:XRE family transcriptional regulator [Actinomadura sp. 7K507]TDC97256.1 XRE family transcriptional regulator [Actinomadura sp. 7K507]
MPHTISRARRKELAAQARTIRSQGQRSGWPVEKIAAHIRGRLPQVLPLEAWRWAYGWSRADVIGAIADLYLADGLGVPAVNPAMLCRWEHGAFPPGPEYGIALCRIYNATPAQLGLPTWASPPAGNHRRGYGAWQKRPQRPRNGALMAAGDNGLAALRESVELAREVEGPAGGQQTRDNLAAALAHYDLRYSQYPPAVLSQEVHRCRTLVNDLLHQPQPETSRRELRRIAGWLSAAVGNLAFHLGDQAAADVHLATAARLGTDVGDRWLQCWTTGARAMIAYYGNRHAAAIELAQHAYEQAESPLRQAQILAWGLLRPTAALGPHTRTEIARLSGQAQDAMDAAPDDDVPGRFGFDRAELAMHQAEAALVASDPAQATRYAGNSLQHIPHGRPGWAAATLVFARAEAAQGRADDAASLAMTVLDTMPQEALRATTRDRLTALQNELHRRPGTPSHGVMELYARTEALPPLAPTGHASNEPNGH